MSVITARGADSSEAMDEVIRLLGVNAFILSTSVRDGLVEIRASSELPRPEPKVEPAASTFAALLEARSDWAPPPPIRPAVPPRRTPWARTLPEDRFKALLDRLEAKLLVPHPVPVGQVLPRTVIVGPPGAGKSLLAVRIAAAAILAEPALAPRIIAPRMSQLLSEDRLRGWSRLLGILPERPLLSDFVQGDTAAEPEASRPQIIDLSDVPDARVDLVASMASTMPTEVILALPSSLSARRAQHEAKRWAELSPRVCLTFTDLGGPDGAMLRALAEGGVRLARATEGSGVINTVYAPVRADMARWLQEEADEDDDEQSEARA